MRTSKALAAALLSLISTAAAATPNAFWTFGFDLPNHRGRAPRFGEAIKEQRYVVALTSDFSRQGVKPVMASNGRPSEQFTSLNIPGTSASEVGLPAAHMHNIVDQAPPRSIHQRDSVPDLRVISED